MKFQTAIISTLLLLAPIYAASPWLALSEIDLAVQKRDVFALERIVDWDAVRTGFRSDITAYLNSKLMSEKNEAVRNAVSEQISTWSERMVSTISAPGFVSLLKQTSKNPSNPGHLAVSKSNFSGIDEFVVSAGNANQLVFVMKFENFRWRVKRAILDIAPYLQTRAIPIR